MYIEVKKKSNLLVCCRGVIFAIIKYYISKVSVFSLLHLWNKILLHQ
ncbi:hypothetical protein U0070_023869 [Myodes glareolus]|uniref:Uncharacterized protein n=1 Tax=Myodes glareolus TaxID=447135 RepID=A0AAW0HW24_MYOGA